MRANRRRDVSEDDRRHRARPRRTRRHSLSLGRATVLQALSDDPEQPARAHDLGHAGGAADVANSGST